MTARKTLFVILGILMILAGITCFFTPVETSSVIPFIFGLAMVIDGIGRIIAWFSIREYAPRSGWVLASSIISLVFGLILTTSPMLQMSVGVFVVLLTGWWILALGIIRIVHAFHLLKIKRESPDFVFGEMIGSNWWVALILGLLLGVLGLARVYGCCRRAIANHGNGKCTQLPKCTRAFSLGAFFYQNMSTKPHMLGDPGRLRDRP